MTRRLEPAQYGKHNGKSIPPEPALDHPGQEP
jgi:hypothetical protein